MECNTPTWFVYICGMIDLPHFGSWILANGAYDPEIQTWPQFLYNVPTHQVSSSYG